MSRVWLAKPQQNDTFGDLVTVSDLLLSVLFYEEIDGLNLRAVGRAHGPVVRLFQRPQLIMPIAFEAFRASPRIRAFYLYRTAHSSGATCTGARTRTRGTRRSTGATSLPRSSGEEMPSLDALLLARPFDTLARRPVRLLLDPMALSRFPPSPEIAVIDSFVEPCTTRLGSKFPGANLGDRDDGLAMAWARTATRPNASEFGVPLAMGIPHTALALAPR
jgi:hypothetical protein